MGAAVPGQPRIGRQAVPAAGNPALQPVLVECVEPPCAMATCAYYRRQVASSLASAVRCQQEERHAVAHKLIVIIWHINCTGPFATGSAPTASLTAWIRQERRRLVIKLEARIGVTLEPAARNPILLTLSPTDPASLQSPAVTLAVKSP